MPAAEALRHRAAVQAAPAAIGLADGTGLTAAGAVIIATRGTRLQTVVAEQLVVTGARVVLAVVKRAAAVVAFLASPVRQPDVGAAAVVVVQDAVHETEGVRQPPLGQCFAQGTLGVAGT